MVDNSRFLVYTRARKLIRSNHLLRTGRQLGVTIRGMKIVNKMEEEKAEKRLSETVLKTKLPTFEPPKNVTQKELPQIKYGWVCPMCGTVYAPSVEMCSKCSK